MGGRDDKGWTYSADASHSMMNTTGTETALDDLEATTLAQDDVIKWYTDVVEGDVTVAVRCVVVAKDAQHAVDGDSRGICWHQDDALLLVWTWVVLV